MLKWKRILLCVFFHWTFMRTEYFDISEADNINNNVMKCNWWLAWWYRTPAASKGDVWAGGTSWCFKGSHWTQTRFMSHVVYSDFNLRPSRWILVLLISQLCLSLAQGRSDTTGIWQIYRQTCNKNDLMSHCENLFVIFKYYHKVTCVFSLLAAAAAWTSNISATWVWSALQWYTFPVLWRDV